MRPNEVTSALGVRNEELERSDPLKEKGFAFSLRIVKLNRYLVDTYKEYILSKQLLRSGTAIGALIREAKYAQSKADFVHKLTIALKEANETDYWLDLLHQSHYLDDKMYHSIQPDIDELLSLLIASTKTAKKH
jgi:four helix bundle protein